MSAALIEPVFPLQRPRSGGGTFSVVSGGTSDVAGFRFSKSPHAVGRPLRRRRRIHGGRVAHPRLRAGRQRRRTSGCPVGPGLSALEDGRAGRVERGGRRDVQPEQPQRIAQPSTRGCDPVPSEWLSASDARPIPRFHCRVRTGGRAFPSRRGRAVPACPQRPPAAAHLHGRPFRSGAENPSRRGFQLGDPGFISSPATPGL